MLDFNSMDGLRLCSLSYFDIVDYQKGMPFSSFIQSIDTQKLRSDPFYEDMRNFLHTMDFSRYDDFIITEYVNYNNKSGLVFFVIENSEQMIVVFRGSEYLDELHHECGWEDWRDNLEIFLGVTRQQLEVSQWFNQLETDKKIILCGHSKGGNLALYLGVTCTDDKLDQITNILTMNAPGINDDMMIQYQERLADERFLNKCMLIENEHDCVSSFFNHIKAPIICASVFSSNSINDVIANHQPYAFKFEKGELILKDKKSVLPIILDQMINKVLAKQNREFKVKLIDQLMEYVSGNLQKEELYHVVLYHLGKRRALFDGYGEDEIKTIEVDTLLNGLTDSIKKQLEEVPSMLGKMFDELNITIKNKISEIRGETDEK